MVMSDQEQPDLVKQVHQIDFAAALRHEQEQAAALRRAEIPLMPSRLSIAVRVLIGTVLCGGGVFVGWLVWHR